MMIQQGNVEPCSLEFLDSGEGLSRFLKVEKTKGMAWVKVEGLEYVKGWTEESFMLLEWRNEVEKEEGVPFVFLKKEMKGL